MAGKTSLTLDSSMEENGIDYMSDRGHQDEKNRHGKQQNKLHAENVNTLKDKRESRWLTGTSTLKMYQAGQKQE
ncbi:hypothetical protein KDW_41180 [Dictyobacter vulcani]|uniref:Uncharacterized protein n=1 Tax=Dictyobacter vulcani TaxID=2607529 RepID=A0A5J4KXP3_9CHLR|nr:hypothetical protein KDW_41180 [Dictyobacter vulcani]